MRLKRKMMMIRKYLMYACFMLVLTQTLRAEDSRYRMPRFSFLYDFNALFSKDYSSGPRVQVYSNNQYFGNKERKRRTVEHTFAYAYGIGLGSYSVKSLEKEGADNGLYHGYAILTLCLQNQSPFEPFVGIYPGATWGTKKGFFANPTAGINITALKINRNWNSTLLQTYVQLRVEYNTLLSSAFLGGGLVLQFP